MKNPWFRLYSKIMTDPKIEMLAFEDQRHFIWILCMKNEGYLDEIFPKIEMRDRMISRKLGVHGEAFENVKRRLLEVNLIDEEWNPVSWESLQFISDQDLTRNERQKRFRDNKRNALCNAQVTPLDTDTDTDTDTEQNLYTPENVSGLQKPKKINPEIELLKQHGVEGKVAIDFLVVRKKKKLPLTETAMDGIVEEAEKANLSVLQAVTISTKKGWGGFDSTWNWPGKAKCGNTNNFNPVPGRYTPTTEDIYADF
jgi:hypothetical protein